MRTATLAVIALGMIVGCAETESVDLLWKKADKVGQDRIFFAKIDGKPQKVVWVSSVNSPKSEAIYQAHRKGKKVLGKGARDIDVRITHRQDGRCQVNMLLTVP